MKIETISYGFKDSIAIKAFNSSPVILRIIIKLNAVQVIESTEKGSEAETEGQARCVRVSQLNLVDLAGSERAKSTGMCRLQILSHMIVFTFVNKRFILKIYVALQYYGIPTYLLMCL